MAEKDDSDFSRNSGKDAGCGAHRDVRRDCESALWKAEIIQTLLGCAGLLILLVGTAMWDNRPAVIVAAVFQVLIVMLYARQINIVSTCRTAFRDQIHDEAMKLLNDVISRDLDARRRPPRPEARPPH